MEFLDQEIQETKAYENSIVVVKASNKDEVTLPKSMTGLVAMEFVKKISKASISIKTKNF